MHLTPEMQCAAKFYQKLNLHTAYIFAQKTPNRVRNQNLAFHFDLVEIIISQPD